jgi:hypothetical protein
VWGLIVGGDKDYADELDYIGIVMVRESTPA